MKKIIIAAALLAVAGTQGAKAGDREWAVVGKVLTGIAAADIISHAVAGPTYYQSSYYAPAPVPVQYAPPVYYTPPVVYRPAPVVYAPRPVVYAPAPVVCAPPVVYAPRPVVVAPTFRVGFGFGFGHRVHPGHGHW